MKIKFHSGDSLPLNKTMEIPIMTIVVKVVFHKNNNYPQVFFKWISVENIKNVVLQ